MNEALIDTLLKITYVFIGIALAGILVFSVIQLIRDIKSSLATIFGIIGIFLVLLIAYSTTAPAAAQGGFSPGMIQMASAGIMSVYVLGAIAIIGIVVGEIWTSLSR